MRALSPASKPPTAAGVAGTPVHALLHVRLAGAPFGRELLLLASELGRVDAWVVPGHAGRHGVASRIHGVAGVRHRVAQYLSRVPGDRSMRWLMIRGAQLSAL